MTWTYSEREHALLTERNKAESILAEALGYIYSEEYKVWDIGDHTIVTLAMEARSVLKGLRR